MKYLSPVFVFGKVSLILVIFVPIIWWPNCKPKYIGKEGVISPSPFWLITTKKELIYASISCCNNHKTIRNKNMPFQTYLKFQKMSTLVAKLWLKGFCFKLIMQQKSQTHWLWTSGHYDTRARLCQLGIKPADPNSIHMLF